MAIPLGPFDLQHPVGRGGMGIVWLGHHRSQGVPVAVKVITAKAASTEEYHRAFQLEVRAVSALDHPGVVWIFDSGIIPEESARASNGDLVAGSPYLVMEYASHGTLRQQNRLLPWSDVRAIVMTLLDALAHAHARGVLHRDLKPDNILIAGTSDLRPGFKITDFGIARTLDETAQNEVRPVGTPQYMAPEQIRNDTHQFGPHTDLYALGNLAWRLVTGKLPFHGMKGAPLMYAQLHREPPALEPAMEVPPGLETFLRTLLAKEPHQRFQRASDAALALASLPEPGGQPVGIPTFEVAPKRSGNTDRIDLDTATLKVLVHRKPQEAPQIGPELRPPFPQTWRLPPTASRPLRLMGAGLGLYGVRPVPLVGRETERDLLWDALSDVHHQYRARAVLVRGPPGVGRSRLVHWVADRAHEVGGALVLKIAFAAADDAVDQIRRALVRLLQTTPLSPSVRSERFGPLFSGAGLDRLAVADAIDLLLGGDEEGSGLSEPDRQALLRRVFEILSADRPLLVVFDDAQWGPESLKLARHLLEAQERSPSRVLLALTVREDPLALGHAEVTRLAEALAARPDVRQVVLGPLEGDERLDLVMELLGFELALAHEVAARTEGNPLFAVQLVADWVERGMLRAGPTGFGLVEPSAGLPPTLDAVWEDRIRALAARLEAPALQLLERAAVLGREVDVLEWQAICDDPDGRHAAAGRAYLVPRHARLRQALMDRLLARKLAHPTDRGFVFSHALFRDALLERARNAGRYREHAASAAAVLVHRATDADGERIGRLMAAAGDLDGAVSMLLRGERHRRRTTGAVTALDLLDTLEQTLKQARAPSSHRGWAELAARRASALAVLGRMEEAAQQAASAHQLAERGGWPELRAISASVLGARAEAASALAEAGTHWQEAAQLLGEDGDVAATVRALHHLRRIAWSRGDLSEAEARGERIRTVLARAVDDHDRAAALCALADHVRARGSLDEARALAEEAATLAEHRGDLAGESRARVLLAEIAERRGEARGEWQRAIALLDTLGDHRRALASRCRLALVECRDGRFEAARDLVGAVLDGAEPAEPELRTAVHAVLALGEAGLARWERLDAHLGVCEAAYPALRTREPRYAEAMALAGDQAMLRHQHDRALRAWGLAELRHRALGDEPRAEAIRAKIDQADITERGTAR